MTVTERDCQVPVNLMIKQETSKTLGLGWGQSPPIPQAGKLHVPSKRKRVKSTDLAKTMGTKEKPVRSPKVHANEPPQLRAQKSSVPPLQAQ